MKIKWIIVMYLPLLYFSVTHKSDEGHDHRESEPAVNFSAMLNIGVTGATGGTYIVNS